jgi:hypothetical protein
MNNIDPNEAIDFIYKNSPFYAEAKANRSYLEQFRKSKKALIMIASTARTDALKEAEAYSNLEYQALLTAYKNAVETEEKLRWQMVAAQARIEIWRTQSANNRNMDKAAT